MRLPELPLNATDVEWLNFKQAGEAFPALGERYIKKLVYARRLPFFKPQGEKGRTFVKRSDIEAFLESGRHDAIGAA